MLYASILAFMVVAVGFVFGSLLLGKAVRPSKPDDVKLDTYECGETPVGQAWFNFNPRFYVIALVFIIFDVEIAFVYPVVTVVKRWAEQGKGATALVEIFLFMAVLLFGLAYVWKKGDLEWVRESARAKPLVVAKSLAGEETPAPSPLLPTSHP